MAKPILFNTEMVRAILEGRKTVTRRLVKPQPNSTFDKNWECFTKENGEVVVLTKPYSPGDILYVREAFCPNYFDREIANFYCDGNRTAYKADFDSEKFGDVVPEPKWKPSIHMPKAMARIFLRVTDVRVERLRDPGSRPLAPDLHRHGPPRRHDAGPARLDEAAGGRHAAPVQQGKARNAAEGIKNPGRPRRGGPV